MAGSISATYQLDNTAPKKHRSGGELFATVSNMADPVMEPQTSRNESDIFNHYVKEYIKYILLVVHGVFIRAIAILLIIKLLSQVNCNDDKGVIYGRWDGEYGDGKSPTSWNGSVKILKQWNDAQMREVKYGQCWVFSGVLNTGKQCLFVVEVG